MLLASDPWYSNGTLWAALGVAVAALGVGVGAWATKTAGRSKRAVCYWSRSRVRMKPHDGATPLATALSVQHGGGELSDPHVVSIVFSNRGRRDVTSDMFHGGSLPRIRFKTPILEVFNVRCAPSNSIPPTVTVSGQEVVFGDFYLKAGAEVDVSILVDEAGPVQEDERGRLVKPEVLANFTDGLFVPAKDRDDFSIPRRQMYLFLASFYILTALVGVLGFYSLR